MPPQVNPRLKSALKTGPSRVSYAESVNESDSESAGGNDAFPMSSSPPPLFPFRDEDLTEEEKTPDDASDFHKDDDGDGDDENSVWTFRNKNAKSSKRRSFKNQAARDEEEEASEDILVRALRRLLCCLFVVVIIGLPIFHFLWVRSLANANNDDVFEVYARQVLESIQAEFEQLQQSMHGTIAVAGIVGGFDQLVLPSTTSTHSPHQHSPVVISILSGSISTSQELADANSQASLPWPTVEIVQRQSHYVDVNRDVVVVDQQQRLDAAIIPSKVPSSSTELPQYPILQVQPIHMWALQKDVREIVGDTVSTNDKSQFTLEGYFNADADIYFQGMLGQQQTTMSNTPISWVHAYNSNNGMRLSSLLDWGVFFNHTISTDDEPVPSIHIVLANSCKQVTTFEVNDVGMIVNTINDRDASNHGDWRVTGDLFTTTTNKNDICKYTLSITPKSKSVFINDNDESTQIYLILSVIFMIIITIVTFATVIFYDSKTNQKLRLVLENSKIDHAVAKQMFPQRVLQRIIHQDKTNTNTEQAQQPQQRLETEIEIPSQSYQHPKQELKSLLMNGQDDDDVEKLTDEDVFLLHKSPLAELFPYCTVAFTDISGFSPWSSEREPAQVFTLLESIFQTMDALARRRGVFKVETIGDSYMAVTGLPDPQADHALRMARFARDCMHRVHEQFRMLEVTLGPDTGDLRLKIGMHSGQVTAGVLRGQKTRFQLFGDTVNTAARMESTCLKSRIQISESTARLLIQSGKRGWVRERLNAVHAKGKGILKTFWLATSSKGRSAQSVYTMRTNAKTVFNADSDEEDEEEEEALRRAEMDDSGNGEGGKNNAASILPSWSRNAKQQRLIDWLVKLLETQLKEVIYQRQQVYNHQKAGSSNNGKNQNGNNSKDDQQLLKDPDSCYPKRDMVLDEVVEAFVMPKQQHSKHINTTAAQSIELDDDVKTQLREYVAAISDRYRFNSFHSFEHASHVTMASVKLLKRIVAPDDEMGSSGGKYNAIDGTNQSSRLHDHTYGIASDALAQFAVVFGALIHDVDHTGVPNGQLGKESPKIADRYKNQSLAEQNSVDIAWKLLMSSEYTTLRQCIFTTRHELKRFRQYVVNFVMATDIFNPKMKALRNQRWEKAFPNTTAQRRTSDISKKSIDTVSLMEDDNNSSSDGVEEALNLKATIVLEHIIQAADVSHTMQHWNVYKKWNERLFMEMYIAFKENRADKDPSEGWYAGELWFYDNYIIPLARKLDECRVFGVSSDECLNYAMENRKEWQAKGLSIVEEMVEKYQQGARNRASEVGGFAPAEIKTFKVSQLQYVLEHLKKKGEALTSIETWDKSGMRSAAQALLDALEIFRKCPASQQLENLTVLFSICYKIMENINDGRLLQTDNRYFEENLAYFFSDEAHKVSDVDATHYSQALGSICNVYATRGEFDRAVQACDDLEKTYLPSVHAFEIANIYGVDYALDALSNRVIWLYLSGDGHRDAMLDAAKYVLESLIPKLDASNLNNIMRAILPVMMALKDEPVHLQQVKVAFDEYVMRNAQRSNNNGQGQGSGSTPMHVPTSTLKYLLDVWMRPNDPLVSSGLLQYAIKGATALVEMAKTPPADEKYLTLCLTRVGWCPFALHGELCNGIAKKMLVNPNATSIPKMRQNLRQLSIAGHKVIRQSHLSHMKRDSFKKNAMIKPFLDSLWDDAIATGQKIGNEIVKEQDNTIVIDDTKPLSLETSFGLVWIVE
eukprot:CAMPEP_0119570654 /NCGR_PEP_ID=MMETSP1352-20130426/43720_1 /TAXON_ID=265584 /ORGANISM="Stauroneis constricta, Strain CCMP1120" /LENGTH=1723 /DNA_ID=CAMNT_0007620323 /DNA_START=525 /DNA_END=5699 /DNA_ORIENTATION=+